MTSSSATPRFAPGTFTPQPQPASHLRMVRAQVALETKLFLRHGEQMLLSMVIPLAMLIGLTLMPLGIVPDPAIDHLMPPILAIAVLSSGFTGQAIAVAFDRRYGALKQLGAAALPAWGVIAGKIGAITIVVTLQTIIFCAVGFALGWRPHPLGLVIAAVLLLIGTATFVALGLLIGGTLPSEAVLALANLLWFVFSAIAGLAVMGTDNALAQAVSHVVPSSALTISLQDAFTTGHLALPPVLILLLWAGMSTLAAVKLFRFDA